MSESASLLPRPALDTPGRPRSRSRTPYDDSPTPPITYEAFKAMIGASANLMATSMGTGMLALPIAVYYSGAVTGTVLIIAMAILSDISLVFLVKAAGSPTRRTRKSWDDTIRPPGELIVNVSLVALLLRRACRS